MDNEKEQCLINLCQGPECREYGGPELLKRLRRMGLRTATEHCQGLCHFAPIAHIDKRCIGEATVKKIIAKLD